MTFDLERARGLRDFLQDDCAEVGDVWAEMIAEIERLRGGMENYGDDYVCQMKSKDARIQELEEALVEMVATNPCNIPTLCDVVHDELMCPALDGNCDFWKGCPQKNELREAARKQLHAEGKIGPDAKPREGLFGKYIIRKSDGHPVDPEADYFVMRLDTDPVARRAAREYSYVTPDRNLARGLQDRLARYDPQLKDCMNIQFFGLAKPHCWQITAERIDVLGFCLSGEFNRCGCAECDRAVAVLRAMLEEAE